MLGTDFTVQKQKLRDRMPTDANLYQDNLGVTIQKQIKLATTNLKNYERIILPYDNNTSKLSQYSMKPLLTKTEQKFYKI